MKYSRKSLNIIAGILAALVLAVVIWGCIHGADPVHTLVSGGIEQINFDTMANGQAADNLALKMVRDVYEPAVKAIDRRYSVIVQF